MKILRNILCVLLVISMLALVLASCNKPQEDEKDLLATYDGGKVYTKDIENWVNYLYVYNYDAVVAGQMTNKDVATQAISTYLLNMFLEDELKKVDMAITSDELKLLVNDFKAELEDSFDETDSSTGTQYKGYEGWLKAFGVSEEFTQEYIKFKTQEQLLGEYLIKTANPSDVELKEYYNDHAYDYAVKAAYIYNFALIEVKDMQDEEEVANAKKEAEQYISDLKDGKITFEEVVDQVKVKYNKNKGYSGMSWNISDINSELDDLSYESLPKVKNLDEFLSFVEETYKDIMDPTAEVDSNEYKAYLQYLFDIYRGKLAYILNQKLIGVYAEPLEYPNGYVVFELVKHRDASWGAFEEIKDKVKEDYLTGKINSDLSVYEAKILENHKVEMKDFEVTEK